MKRHQNLILMVAVVLLAVLTVAGAGVRPGVYLCVALPALIFLGLSCLSLAFSLNLDQAAQPFAVQATPGGVHA